jgi:hypothetical protein
MTIEGGALLASCSMHGARSKSCRSGLRAASGVRSGTRRRRGSLGRSDVVVGCPAVGFQTYAFSANVSRRLHPARRLPTPLPASLFARVLASPLAFACNSAPAARPFLTHPSALFSYTR